MSVTLSGGIPSQSDRDEMHHRRATRSTDSGSSQERELLNGSEGFDPEGVVRSQEEVRTVAEKKIQPKDPSKTRAKSKSDDKESSPKKAARVEKRLRRVR
jgi:hypothetical protein